MAIPEDRKYSQSHEWYKLDGGIVTVGITDFAANELTDITYVQLPEVSAVVTAGSEIGDIESVKATSPLCCAVAGEVVEVNEDLADGPELVNQEPFGRGWMVKIKVADLSTLEALMSAEQYEAHLSSCSG